MVIVQNYYRHTTKRIYNRSNFQHTEYTEKDQTVAKGSFILKSKLKEIIV